MYVPHFVYPSVDGHLGGFHLLAVMDNVMNIGIHMSESQLSIFQGIHQKWDYGILQ